LVRAAATKSLKALNHAAGQRMAKGDYATAELLAAKGKEIRQFQLEVEALRGRWREVCGTGGRGVKQSVTPLWSYYQPALRALVQAGGQCRRTDLEERVERLMSASLQPGDRQGMARGRERWRVMLQRVRRALVAEGWIEDGVGAAWRITEAGRLAAEKPISRDAGSAER
jgi:hypothetical protein